MLKLKNSFQYTVQYILNSIMDHYRFLFLLEHCHWFGLLKCLK